MPDEDVWDKGTGAWSEETEPQIIEEEPQAIENQTEIESGTEGDKDVKKIKNQE